MSNLEVNNLIVEYIASRTCEVQEICMSKWCFNEEWLMGSGWPIINVVCWQNTRMFVMKL